MKCRLSDTKKVFGIVFTWLIGIAITIPQFLSKTHQSFQGEAYCFAHEKTVFNPYYIISFVLLLWILPITVVTILYGIGIRKLSESSFLNNTNDSMKKRVMQNKKVAKMFIVIGIIFWLCTMPFAIFLAPFQLYFAYAGVKVDKNLIWKLHFSLFALININSCLNPLVYTRYQPDIKAFWKKARNKLFCKAS